MRNKQYFKKVLRRFLVKLTYILFRSIWLWAGELLCTDLQLPVPPLPKPWQTSGREKPTCNYPLFNIKRRLKRFLGFDIFKNIQAKTGAASSLCLNLPVSPGCFYQLLIVNAYWGFQANCAFRSIGGKSAKSTNIKITVERSSSFLQQPSYFQIICAEEIFEESAVSTIRTLHQTSYWSN